MSLFFITKENNKKVNNFQDHQSSIKKNLLIKIAYLFIYSIALFNA